MKTRILLASCLLTLASAALAQPSFGTSSPLADGWLFRLADDTAALSPQYDDSRWARVGVPHDWSVALPMSPDCGSCQGYLPGGIAWYRRHLTPAETAAAASGRLYIYFEGVYNHSEVYVNGQLLGKRPSGFASFLYDMTPCLREEGNTVAVRVDHGQEFDSRWYTGSGIYRNVWLVSAPEVHLAQWGTAYRLTAITKSKASVEVDVETTDDGRSKKEEGRSKKEGWNARVELIDRDGKTVASAKTAIGSNGKKTVRLTVKNPQRWKPARP